MSDAPAGTSFLQSLAEIDHRDRFHHHAPNHKHHEYLHRRQLDAALQIDTTVTSVTSTVSVIQDIEIDSNGNTIQIQTWLAASTSIEAPTDTTVPAPTIIDTTLWTSSAAAAAAPSTTPTLGPLNTEMISQVTSIAPQITAIPTSQALPLTSPPFLATNSSCEYESTVSISCN
jgi:hypothetical protein